MHFQLHVGEVGGRQPCSRTDQDAGGKESSAIGLDASWNGQIANTVESDRRGIGGDRVVGRVDLKKGPDILNAPQPRVGWLGTVSEVQFRRGSLQDLRQRELVALVGPGRIDEWIEASWTVSRRMGSSARRDQRHELGSRHLDAGRRTPWVLDQVEDVPTSNRAPKGERCE